MSSGSVWVSGPHRRAWQRLCPPAVPPAQSARWYARDLARHAQRLECHRQRRRQQHDGFQVHAPAEEPQRRRQRSPPAPSPASAICPPAVCACGCFNAAVRRSADSPAAATASASFTRRSLAAALNRRPGRFRPTQPRAEPCSEPTFSITSRTGGQSLDTHRFMPSPIGWCLRTKVH